MDPARSRGVKSRKVTRVTSCSTISHPGVSKQPGQDLMRSAAERLEHLGRLLGCGGLSVQTTVQHDRRVDAEHRPLAGLRRHRPRLALRVRARELDGINPGPSSSTYRGATTSKGRPSCSRIARRCGDVEARRSGGAGGALTPAYARPTDPPPATVSPTPPPRSRSTRGREHPRVLAARPAAPRRTRLPRTPIHSPCAR